MLCSQKWMGNSCSRSIQVVGTQSMCDMCSYSWPPAYHKVDTHVAKLKKVSSLDWKRNRSLCNTSTAIMQHTLTTIMQHTLTTIMRHTLTAIMQHTLTTPMHREHPFLKYIIPHSMHTDTIPEKYRTKYCGIDTPPWNTEALLRYCLPSDSMRSRCAVWE